MRAAQLNLSPSFAPVAVALEAAFPGVYFTSGRRDVEQQSQAMADNVIVNRKYVVDTYRESPERDVLQLIIDANSQPMNHANMAALILRYLRSLTDEQLGHLTKHPAGLAFDVRPEGGSRGDAIKAWLFAKAKEIGGKFLDKESGIEIWHLQC